MGTRGRGDMGRGMTRKEWRHFKPAPVARAIAMALAAGGMVGSVQAQQAFSPAWFAAKGAAQANAATTGRLPNGAPASSLAGINAAQRANAQRSYENLNLAARAIAAQQAVQAAAREAAWGRGPDLVDGLGEGGLKVDGNSLTAGWLNAQAPVQTQSAGRTEVVIGQTAEKAILNWETFNVGRNTTVRFDQRGGAQADGSNTWIALNRVNDPSGRPSQIAGRIQAEGSVYIVNRNGILFTGTSQVNTRSLVASSLRLTDEQFKLGINNPRRMSNGGNDFAIPQFGEFTTEQPVIYGQSGYQPGDGTTPDKLGTIDRFVPGAPPGEVVVEAGATLATGQGGKLMLFAPKVRNAGALSAPDGQVILAAGENVFLATPRLDDPAGVRGLDVAVSAVPGWAFTGGQVAGALGLSPVYGDAQFVAGLRDVVFPEMAQRAAQVGYEVVNTGNIRSDRGNITLQARDVRQLGALTATTALNNRSGSILLRAWGLGTHMYADGMNELVNWSAGTLTLGPSSVTQVLPDASDIGEIEASALATRYQPGRVDLYGQLIDLKPQAGVLVPAGTINLESAVNPLFTQQPWYKPGSVGDASRIYIDSDAFLSVAGVRDVLVPMARNFVEVELRINELRDSPLLRDSWLRGSKLIVDRRANGIFTDGPMAGVNWVQKDNGSGQVGYVPGEWIGTPLGDVAGWVGVGKTDLAELSADAGTITMRAGGSVITRGGSMLDISGGSVRYTDGVNTATKLLGADGRLYTMDRALPDIGYVGIAGQYASSSPRWGVKETWRSPVIGANAMEGGYVEGRNAGSVQVFAGDAMVLEGEVWGGTIIGDRQQSGGNGGGRLELGGGSVEDKPWSPGKIVVGNDPLRLGADFVSTSALGDEFYMADPSKSRKLTHLLADGLSRSGLGEIALNIVRGDFVLAADAVLELSPGASLFVSGGEGSTSDIYIDGTIRAPGGSLRLDSSAGRLFLGADSRLDAGGQWVNRWRDGAMPSAWAIDAGTVDLGVGELVAAPGAIIDVSGGGRVESGSRGEPILRAGNAGSVRLGGLRAGMDLEALDLRAYALGNVGSLALMTTDSVTIGAVERDDAALHVPASLFAQDGFGNVSISVMSDGGDIVIPEGADIVQAAVGLDLALLDYHRLATGERLADHLPATMPRLEQRVTRGASGLSLGTRGGDIVVGQGARVRTEVGGSLALAAGVNGGTVVVAGRLEAPSGRIDLAGTQVTLSAGGELLARGTPVIYRDARGWRRGEVRDGGAISINTARLSLARGGLVDVSGASGSIDEPSYGPWGPRDPQAVTLDSNGGSISISGTGLVESTLRGLAGGPRAAGGRLRFDMQAASGPDGSSAERLRQAVQWMDPDCYGLAGNGVCDYSNWQEALDFDWSPLIGGAAPFVIPSALLAHLEDRKELVLSEGLPAPALEAEPLDPAAFGLSDAALDFFRDSLLYSDLLREVLQSPGKIHALTVRPGAFAAGGFADLALVNSVQGAIRLDGVDVSANRSMVLSGQLVGHKGASSSLRAPHIALSAMATPGGSAPVAQGGAGRLALNAELIDVVADAAALAAGGGRARITGFGETRFRAGEIRLGSALPEQMTGNEALRVDLDVDGDLVLEAGQVYPGTAMTATLRAGNAIRVERLGGDLPVPLSAGGTLRIEAPVIQQDGVLRAPLGTIELVAGQRLVLGTGSLTSVAGAGIAVPYGTLSNDEQWRDPTKADDGSSTSQAMLAVPPEKRISLQAPDVAVVAGAVVDISGGGDLYAWEHVPGPGGSHDVLAMPGMYAIVPDAPGAAPFSGLPAGERVWLAGGPGLASGWYTLLPARYALLPGAFAVQATGRSWSGPDRPGFETPDGSLVMQGRRGNAYDGFEPVTAAVWRVLPGSTVRRYTEYNEAFANEFFSSDAFKLTQYRLTGQDIVTPRLPRDGGAVVFNAGQTLLLDGSLRSAPAGEGRGGLVDIAGEKIAILGKGQDAAALRGEGYLVIDAASLSTFGAGSLLIGGRRQGAPQGLMLDVTASDIIVRNDAGSALYGPEIILAASDRVAVDGGSVIHARGDAARGTGDLVVQPQRQAVYTDPDGNLDDNWDGVINELDAADDVLTSPAADWGALIRVANGDALKVIRQNVDTTRGGLAVVGAGAVLEGGASLLIDATRTTELAAGARISADDLSVAAGRIGFGGGSGMVLDTATLGQLSDSRHLTLRSYSSFDFHSSLDLGKAGVSSLTFDGTSFAGHGDHDITVRGGTIVLANSGGHAGEAGAGRGHLVLDADMLVLGEGSKRFSGFDGMTFAGRTQIVAEGTGGVDAGRAALTLATPLVTGRGGAAQHLATTGRLAIEASDGNASGLAPQDSLGARLSFTGASIDVNGHVAALGGAVEMVATHGDLVVAEGARIDVGGFAKAFYDVAEFADAGRIALSAVGGNVDLRAGSSLNLAADARGGNAGTLTLAAAGGGSVMLDGAIAAHAGEGGQAGKVALDIETLPAFGALNVRLNEAGFNHTREFRVRKGDVLLDGTTIVEHFLLTADAGTVDIAGTVDARAGYGGSIRVIGGDGVSMRDSARLLAGATGELGSGRVTIEATGGELALAGGVIDVGGAEGGKVRLRAGQTVDHADVRVGRLDVVVAGARSAVLEGVAVYDSGSVDAVKAAAIEDAGTFMANAGTIAARLGGDGITLAPGIEIRSAADLALESDWNLLTDFAASREGTLTLRAGGDLVVGGHLSDGFDRADRGGVLRDTASWNLRLVAGADLAAADALALRPLAAQADGKGSVRVGTAGTGKDGDEGAGKLVRTGTGDIEVRAGRDLVLAHKESVIYTAGRRDTTTWSDFTTANPAAVYGVQGGHLDIQAGGSIQASHSGQRFVEWLNRQGNVGEGMYFGEYNSGEYGVRPDGSYGYIYLPPEQSSWWINYGAFQQGVGALGGGNVKVSAGGDLDNLVVVLPTTMRMRGGRTADEARTMEVRNGGSMEVEAAGAIRGGQYYVARGSGQLRAGETASGHNVVVTRNQGEIDERITVLPVAPVLALGDATLRLATAGDLRVQSVIDPLLIRYGDDGTGFLPRLDHGSYMSGYTGRSALSLVSTGGNVTLVNQAEFAFRDVSLRSNTTGQDRLVGLGGNLYPALTRVVALNGNVENQGPMFVMPGAGMDLNVIADGDVRFDVQNFKVIDDATRSAPYARIVMARAIPGMMPSPDMPAGGGGNPFQADLMALMQNAISPYSSLHAYYKGLANPDVLPLADDHEPSRIYAARGSIVGLDLAASEQMRIRAGTDVRGLLVDARNVRASDITLIDAGNDILAMRPVRDRWGLNNGTGRIVVQGPGALVLAAGRDVYADNLTVETVGNRQFDPATNRPIPGTDVNGLPATGAAITVMAGLDKAPGYDAFAAAYLDPANVAAMPDYLKAAGDGGAVLPVYLTDGIEVRPGGEEKVVRRGLVSYMRDMTGQTLAPLDAWKRFQDLPRLAREQFLRQVYLLELREAGRDQNEPGIGGLPRNGGYNRGHAAIETLFPGDGWRGSVAANTMMLRTMAGGDVSVLTPGGGLQVAALGATVAPGYGLVTLDSGHIDIFARNDVVVNRSRILAFVPEARREGSDMIIWSTEGDIDAGRGAKTLRVPSAPEVLTDIDGFTTMRERSDMSGSGIGTVGDGDLDLIAPEGTVNAGDAGVRVAGNLNIAALHVLNAENIQVKGQSKGLPQVAAVNVGALTNASAAASQAVAAAQDVVQRERVAARQNLPSVFTVRVLGFGGEPASESRGEGREARSGPQAQAGGDRRYDPGHLIQLVGLGHNIDPRLAARLTESERRQLERNR